MKIILLTDDGRVDTEGGLSYVRALIDSYHKIKEQGFSLTLNRLCRKMKDKPERWDFEYKSWLQFQEIKYQKITNFRVFTDRLEITITREETKVETKPYMAVRLNNNVQKYYFVKFFIPYNLLAELGLETIDECSVSSEGDSICLDRRKVYCGVGAKAKKQKQGIVFNLKRSKQVLEEAKKNPFKKIGIVTEYFNVDVQRTVDGNKFYFTKGRAKRIKE